MGDDLSQFFAKKSAKVKDKKKKVKLSVDEVGQVLERKARRQEERDREDEEEERRAQDDASFFDKRPEDSEWLEYKDTNKEIALEELGIRDMNLTEQTEEAMEDEKAATNEAPKTWSTAEKKESEEILSVPKKQTTAVWKPRCLMQNITRASAVPNINDQDLFPTFEAAEKIEKLKKDDEKRRRNDGFTTVSFDRDSSGPWTNKGTSNAWQHASGGGMSSSNADRTALLSTVRQVTSSGTPNPVPPSHPLQTNNSNTYITPIRRRFQGNFTKKMS
ncbi:Uncharacterized protein BM_BM9047 [Brugia malayi]|uniref:Bm9047 n=3 Tax=Brugia TaxID=6278 RepID=A0A0K0JXX0_BRUMA|nr:Uncharacterized protein BM_BM9047 [Brugia malayi]CDP92525.1 Bm9047 [Brugia malayi]VDN90411.1 unnamed protein product [Brugia pahangi]VIO90146.1 Uncharacterized protein BM_BM9047 [Brugia malayi]